jgi:chromate transport protein ChrA
VVFLGTVAVGFNPVAGAVLGYLGIYIPGILIKFAILGVWEKMRNKPLLTSALKGVECGAVGLVFTAVYRLWKIGFINQQLQQGGPIDTDPWFVLITIASFTSCKWFRVKPPIAIVSGGLLGMIWYAVIKAHH